MEDTWSARFNWFRRRLQQPAATVAIVLLLLIDLGSVSLGSRSRCCYGYPYAVIVVREHGLALVAHPDEIGESLGLVYANPRERRRGVWAITRVTRDPRIRLDDVLTTMSESQLNEVRRLFARYLEEDWFRRPHPYADLVRQGAGPQTRIIWSGYVHNGVSMGLVVLLLYSLRWILDGARERRATERVRRGVCPRCEYNLYGANHDVCPECGEVVASSHFYQPES